MDPVIHRFLLTKVCIVKAMVFLVVLYGCESWTIKKVEQKRIDASELWCWRKFLRVPWTARRSNQSILKEINPEYSLEGLMLKLKLQYFGYLVQKADSLEETLMLGNIEDRRRRGRQRMRWLGGITNSNWHEFEEALGVGDEQGSLASCSSWGHKESDTTEWLNWTGLKYCSKLYYLQLVDKNPQMWWNHGYKRLTISYRQFSTVQRFGTPNPCVVQGSYI